MYHVVFPISCSHDRWLIIPSLILPLILLSYAIYTYITTVPPQFPAVNGPYNFFLYCLSIPDSIYIIFLLSMMILVFLLDCHKGIQLLSCIMIIFMTCLLILDYAIVGRANPGPPQPPVLPPERMFPIYSDSSHRNISWVWFWLLPFLFHLLS